MTRAQPARRSTLARGGVGRRRRAGPGAGAAVPHQAAHPRAAPPLPRLPAQGRTASAFGAGRSRSRSERHAARRPPPSLARGGDPRLRRATKLAYRDLADLALQEMLSNGCAPPTRETLDILREMHPRGTGAVGAVPPPSVPQVKVSTHQAKAELFKLAHGGQAAPVRGLLRLERVPALPDAGPAGSRPLHSLLPATRAPRVAHRLRRRAGHLRRHPDLWGSGRPASSARPSMRTPSARQMVSTTPSTVKKQAPSMV